MMQLRVLIIGASGVFGSRLAELLANEPGVEIVLGGRRRKNLELGRGESGGTGSYTILTTKLPKLNISMPESAVGGAPPSGDLVGRSPRVRQCLAMNARTA